MSVKKCAITGMWKADFRVNGKRIRQKFLTRDQAREFEFNSKLKVKVGFADTKAEKGMLLSDGIVEFVDLKTEKKKSCADEKAFLRGFYQYMTHMEGIVTFPEVKLIHLNRYQEYLQSATARELLWDKVEAARKLDKNSDYIPRVKPRSFEALSGSSINRHFNSIKSLFGQAKKWEWIESNPSLELDSVHESPQKRKPWPSDRHIQTAIDLAKPWASRSFFFIAKTGTRPVWIKYMEWSHVDFENRRFKVISYKGRRGMPREHWMPMTKDIYDFLKYMWSIRRVGKYGHLVFHSASGFQICTKRLAKEMARVTKLMGLVGYTLYGFRHSFVTMLANPSNDGTRTGSLEVARKAAGHASIVQTQRYNHIDDLVVREELETLSQQRKIVFEGERNKESASGWQNRTSFLSYQEADIVSN